MGPAGRSRLSIRPGGLLAYVTTGGQTLCRMRRAGQFELKGAPRRPPLVAPPRVPVPPRFESPVLPFVLLILLPMMPFIPTLALVLLTVSVGLVFIRLVRGPRLADRVVALDVLTALAIGIIAVYTAGTGATALLDAALVLALVAFMATVAFAQFVERDRSGEPPPFSQTDADRASPDLQPSPPVE